MPWLTRKVPKGSRWEKIKGDESFKRPGQGADYPASLGSCRANHHDGTTEGAGAGRAVHWEGERREDLTADVDTSVQSKPAS